MVIAKKIRDTINKIEIMGGTAEVVNETAVISRLGGKEELLALKGGDIEIVGRYSKLDKISDQRIIYTTDGKKYGIIDSFGNKVVESNYSTIHRLHPGEEYDGILYAEQKDVNIVYIIDHDGNHLIADAVYRIDAKRVSIGVIIYATHAGNSIKLYLKKKENRFKLIELTELNKMIGNKKRVSIGYDGVTIGDKIIQWEDIKY